MLHTKIAFVAGVIAASLLGGIALGGFTAGGFKDREQTDIIAQAASRVRSGGFRAATAEPEAPMYHVCKGCDAKLYRADDWYGRDAAYDAEDEWAREERESRDVIRAALADRRQDRDGEGEMPMADDFSVNQDVAGQASAVIARLDD